MAAVWVWSSSKHRLIPLTPEAASRIAGGVIIKGSGERHDVPSGKIDFPKVPRYTSSHEIVGEDKFGCHVVVYKATKTTYEPKKGIVVRHRDVYNDATGTATHEVETFKLVAKRKVAGDRQRAKKSLSKRRRAVRDLRTVVEL